MAIAYGTITVDTDTSGILGSFSFNHDNEGDDVLTFVLTVNNPSSTDMVMSSVQFDSVAMTQIGHHHHEQSNSPEVWIFVLSNPNSGLNVLSGTFSANPNSWVAGAQPVSGADATDPIGAVGEPADTTPVTSAPSESVTIDTPNSDLLLFSALRDGTNAPPVSPGTDMTELDESSSGSSTAGDNVAWLGKRATGAVAAYTAAATYSSSERASWVAFELHIAAAVADLNIFDHHYRMMRAA